MWSAQEHDGDNMYKMSLANVTESFLAVMEYSN